ncbi:uncharacterized protein LOC135475019 [Liolophura sinensis]|uniref:uncharacterized protein LOC135475019 n=1 Tax=Liolophura sinensis TaxID=3198878 RepID=UPI003157FE42
MPFLPTLGDLATKGDGARDLVGPPESAQNKRENNLSDGEPGTCPCPSARTVVSKVTDDNETRSSEFGEHNQFTVKQSSRKIRSDMKGDENNSFSNVSINIPLTMTFREKLEFFETMFCPRDESVCGSRDITVHPFDCSPYWCYRCSCDSCTSHRDCCLDMAISQLNKPPLRKSLQEYRSCRTATPKPNRDVIKEDWYFFVDTCPRSYRNDSVRKLCESMSFRAENIGRYFPVYSRVTQANYMNIYCAECHKDNQNVLEWKPGVTCTRYKDMSNVQSIEALLNLIVNDYSCALTSVPPVDASVTPCNGSLRTVRSCNETGSWDDYSEDIVKACSMYKSEIFIERTWYRNIFCAFCNGFKVNSALDIFNEEPRFRCPQKPTDPRELGAGTLAFSFIFNLRPTGEKQVLNSSRMMECEQNEVFDETKRVCRQLFCSRGRLLLDHSCVDIYNTTDSLRYKVNYVVWPEKIPHMLNDLDSLFGAHLLRVLIELNKFLLKTSSMEFKMKTCYEVGDQESGQLYVHYMLVELVALFAEGIMTQREIETRLLQLLNLHWRHADGSTWTPNVLASDFVYPHNLTCSGYNFTSPPLSPIAKHLASTYRRQSLIALNKLTRCKQIELDTSEYTTNTSTGEISVHGLQVTLGTADYSRVNGNVRVCVNYSGTYRYHPQPEPVRGPSEDYTERVLTFFSMAVSLLCLSITFTVSLVTNTQASVPGRISVTLVASLFVSQLIYFVIGYVRPLFWPCRIFGIAAHYAWLVVFGWKNVAAYHMYTVFTNPLKKAIVYTNKKFYLYVMYAFGVPALVVGSYLMARALLSESRDIGYGEVACFLSRPIDIGLAFVTPVSIVLFTNTYFFARAVHVIRRMSDFDMNAHRSNSTHNSVFIKMSLILGFTWIVGFVANVVDEPYLWYVFTVLNGGIGVLIFVSQVCRKRTLELWRHRGNVSRVRISSKGNHTDEEAKDTTNLSLSATSGMPTSPMSPI